MLEEEAKRVHIVEGQSLHHWVRGRWKLPTSADRGTTGSQGGGAMPSGRSFEGGLYKISRGGDVRAQARCL